MKKKYLLTISVLLITICACVGLVSCATASTQPPSNVTDDSGATFVYQDIINNTIQSAACIFASNSLGIRSSSGSGFIISTNGYVVTNQHVVGNYKYFEVEVIDDSGKQIVYRAKLVKAFTTPDIAVLKIESTHSFKPIKFAHSNALKFGDPCVMIGNPKGAGIITSRAMVSNPSVAISKTNYVAIDAPVNPGNSGGALINANCEVVGVITSRYTSSGSVNDVVINMGFAQQTEDVMKALLTVNELKDILAYWKA